MRHSLFWTLTAATTVLAFCSIHVAAAQQPAVVEDLHEDIDAMVHEAFAADQPGAAVISVRGGETVYRAARGMANLELSVPLEADMVFRLGSITKQFTAAAIMMLVEEGKVGLDDEITKFLPDYPTQGNTITVEHLLTHSSGIKSYTNMPGWMATRIREDLSVEELVDGFKDEPMEFRSGEEFAYNNSGYVLLGAIIEKASGQSYAEFIRSRIFEPLGMNNSFYGDAAEIIPNRASGYDGGPGAFENSRYISMTQPYAAGSLLSTVDDLAKWNTALFGGQVVSEESLERMTTPYVPANGQANGYGYGLVKGDLRGHTTISHGGGIFGFVTYAVYLPENDVYVAILCNSMAHDPGNVANRIAALCAGDPFPEFEEIKLSTEQLERFAGVYRIDENTTRTVTVEDGKLYTMRTGGGRQQAIPASETEFFFTSSLSHFEFVVDDGGNVTAMRMYQNGSKDFEEATKTEEQPTMREVADIDLGLLDDFVGEYELAPGFTLTVRRDGDQLKAKATGQDEIEIFPESESKFFLKVIDAQLSFHRNDDGQVDQVTLHQAGREITGNRIK